VLHSTRDRGDDHWSMGVVFPKRIYRFGLFEADAESGKLLREGVRVKLQDQPFRLLCLLLERAGELVSREELRQSLWRADTYVEFDGSLNAALKRLRYALGDSADNPIFIETLPKRGYRFLAPVTVKESSPVAVQELPPTVPAPPEPPVEISILKNTESEGQPAISKAVERPRHWRQTLFATAVVVGLAFLVVASYHRLTTGRDHGAGGSISPTPRVVIAVLPFSNEGAGPDFDYLRYAIANDLVTDLTYARSVTVRSFASTRRYGSQTVDPEIVGKELRVTHVVTGGFLKDKQNLRVNLELVEIEQNRPIWREEVTVPPQDLVALHDKLAVRAAQGLLPAMNVAGASPDEISTPKNEQALELFSHSLSIPLDPESNLLAIKKLEESVSLDSSYAPAWGELGNRYYYDYHYGNGGKAAAAKALQAYKRQSELDPNWPAVSTGVRAEQGDVNGAYDQAAAFLRRHPDVALGHHSMSYVLRIAGLLDEANQECSAALALDPGFNRFRSCAIPYVLQGDYGHAQSYIRLDEQSGFGAMLRMAIALRSGNTAAALAESEAAIQGGFRFVDLARMYLNHAPEAELRKATAALEVDPRAASDPEMLYFNAGVLSYCGQGDAALRQLRRAIAGNYCSYPAMDKDPLFDPIRQRAEFADLRIAAVQCQQRFLTHRAQVEATLAAAR